MMGFIDKENVTIKISENEDGVRTVTIQTVDNSTEYEIREEDELDIKIRAGIDSSEQKDFAEAEISDVKAHRFYADRMGDEL